jgi:hypothetical protein
MYSQRKIIDGRSNCRRLRSLSSPSLTSFSTTSRRNVLSSSLSQPIIPQRPLHRINTIPTSSIYPSPLYVLASRRLNTAQFVSKNHGTLSTTGMYMHSFHCSSYDTSRNMCHHPFFMSANTTNISSRFYTQRNYSNDGNVLSRINSTPTLFMKHTFEQNISTNETVKQQQMDTTNIGSTISPAFKDTAQRLQNRMNGYDEDELLIHRSYDILDTSLTPIDKMTPNQLQQEMFPLIQFWCNRIQNNIEILSTLTTTTAGTTYELYNDTVLSLNLAMVLLERVKSEVKGDVVRQYDKNNDLNIHYILYCNYGKYYISFLQ